MIPWGMSYDWRRRSPTAMAPRFPDTSATRRLLLKIFEVRTCFTMPWFSSLSR